MTIGSKITELRKQKGWSQSDLARHAEVSREIIGRYERNDAIPSIEVAKRLADVLEVSLDYLAGDNVDQAVDKATLNRVMQIGKLSEKEKQMVYEFLDAFILKSDLQQKLVH
jgi:transcriptional regulator with XRE-family HTH domain